MAGFDSGVIWMVTEVLVITLVGILLFLPWEEIHLPTLTQASRKMLDYP
jgi:hypothetical protein